MPVADNDNDALLARVPRRSLRELWYPSSFATTRTTTTTTSSGDDSPPVPVRLGLVLLHGSWNNATTTTTARRHDDFMMRLYRATLVANYGQDPASSSSTSTSSVFVGHVLVDESEESLELLLGEQQEQQQQQQQPLPPGELPALAYVLQTTTATKSEDVVMRYIPVRAADIRQAMRMMTTGSSKGDLAAWARVFHSARTVLEQLQDDYPWVDEILYHNNNTTTTQQQQQQALRIFIAGDRSSVGKSSICLGLLGQLLLQYPPERLAYIKPATQSESTQLIQHYCEHTGIPCVPVGPLVYYRGFTRAYLAGETESTHVLLQRCANAVNRLARGKDVIVIDGVGFPAVGSICGTSNADVARVCGYPVLSSSSERTTATNATGGKVSNPPPPPPPPRPLGVCLVGGPGVGAAVDAFNLNATYFAQAGIPVLGAIFNKLPATGFYSLENCQTQVTAYFDQTTFSPSPKRPFGFVPVFAPIAGKNAMQYVDEYIRMFGQHVNVPALLEAARRIQPNETLLPMESHSDPTTSSSSSSAPDAKRLKLETTTTTTSISGNVLSLRSREEIESIAIRMGAAPSV